MSMFELEKAGFHTNDLNGDSELLLEHFDSDELNVYGYECAVDWTPQKIDRLVLNLSLVFGDDSMTVRTRYLNENITGLQNTDFTITDDNNGNITFATFEPGEGVYRLAGFSDSITSACLSIQSTIYIGAKRFLFNYVVTIVTYRLTEDDDSRQDEDGNYRITEN